MRVNFSQLFFRSSLAIILAISNLSGASAAAADSPSQGSISSSDLSGKWKLDTSTAVFEIAYLDGAIQMSGEDSQDGEKFIISNITWDGHTLKADFLMPSTNWRTHAELLQIAPDLLYGKYADGSPEVWRKIK